MHLGPELQEQDTQDTDDSLQSVVNQGLDMINDLVDNISDAIDRLEDLIDN